MGLGTSRRTARRSVPGVGTPRPRASAAPPGPAPHGGRVIGPERAGNARSRGVDGEWWSRGVYGRASSDGTTNAYSFARNRSSEPALAPSALM